MNVCAGIGTMAVYLHQTVRGPSVRRTKMISEEDRHPHVRNAGVVLGMKVCRIGLNRNFTHSLIEDNENSQFFEKLSDYSGPFGATCPDFESHHSGE